MELRRGRETWGSSLGGGPRGNGEVVYCDDAGCGLWGSPDDLACRQRTERRSVPVVKSCKGRAITDASQRCSAIPMLRAMPGRQQVSSAPARAAESRSGSMISTGTAKRRLHLSSHGIRWSFMMATSITLISALLGRTELGSVGVGRPRCIQNHGCREECRTALAWLARRQRTERRSVPILKSCTLSDRATADPQQAHEPRPYPWQGE